MRLNYWFQICFIFFRYAVKWDRKYVFHFVLKFGFEILSCGHSNCKRLSPSESVGNVTNAYSHFQKLELWQYNFLFNQANTNNTLHGYCLEVLHMPRHVHTKELKLQQSTWIKLLSEMNNEQHTKSRWHSAYAPFSLW